MNEIVETVQQLMRDELGEKVVRLTTRLPWFAGEIATVGGRTRPADRPLRPARARSF